MNKRRPVNPARPRPRVAWEPLGNASLNNETEAAMKAADPGYVGTFRSNLYQVTMREHPFAPGSDQMATWLIIRRCDSEAIHDWRHFQRIKNELCGPEREGFEMYPAESRLVDTSNQYHLFVMPEGIGIPFGYAERDISDETRLLPGNRNKQRPFEERPADLNARAEASTITTYGRSE